MEMIWKWPARCTGLVAKSLCSINAKHARCSIGLYKKKTISSCSSVKLLFKYLTSHMIEHKLSDCRTNGTDGSSDCHRHTCGLLWFHTFPVFLHLNLYSNKTNSINKKDQLFSQKKEKCNDYNRRTGKNNN